MISTPKSLLGIGIYTPAEAAFFARIKTRTLNRWVYGDQQGNAVISPQLSSRIDHDDRIVTFLDFVQALAIRAITNMPAGHRVPLPKIREAVNTAKSEYGIEYPFAVQHKTYLFGSDVIIRLNDDDYRPLTGSTKGNKMFTEVVELYKKKLSFDADGFASEYVPLKQGNYSVLMDPKKRLGEPFLPSCGYTAQAIWEGVAAEGSMERAADVFGISMEEVELCCNYFDYLQGNSAA